METILLSLILAIGLAVLYFQIKNRPKQEENVGEKIKDELKIKTSEAFDREVFGAPTFIVNDKLFWGQDRLEYALDEYNS